MRFRKSCTRAGIIEKAGQVQEDAWQQKFSAYREAHPELAAEFERRMSGELPQTGKKRHRHLSPRRMKLRRKRPRGVSSLATLEAFSPLLPELFGGSADLGGSNGTEWSGFKPMRAEMHDANYINYGVREFGMSAMMNGIVLHGGFIPFGATFLVFSDYARNALRMAALMKIQSYLSITHDSIGLGEDGPTHQAVEQIPTLRMIPNMQLWRPCDAVETAVSWKAAIERRDGPSCLVFSRQNLKHQQRSAEQIEAISSRWIRICVIVKGRPTPSSSRPDPKWSWRWQLARPRRWKRENPRGFDAEHHSVSIARRGSTASRCCRRESARASLSKLQ